MQDVSPAAVTVDELHTGQPVAEPSGRAWGMLAVVVTFPLLMAEVITTFVEPWLGLVLYGVLLVTLLVHATVRWGFPIRSLLLSLTLVPLIRIISLSLPLNQFPLTYGYFLTGVPLFVAAALVIRTLPYTWQEIGVTVRQLRLQALVSLTGFLIGFVQYQILRPQPLAKALTPEQLLGPALILLIYVGFVEELIFRGVLQRAATDVLGRAGILYVAILYSLLHLGYKSVPELIVVFSASLFFGWVVAKTGSIAGTALAHGLSNITLFLLLPLLLANP